MKRIVTIAAALCALALLPACEVARGTGEVVRGAGNVAVGTGRVAVATGRFAGRTVGRGFRAFTPAGD